MTYRYYVIRTPPVGTPDVYGVVDDIGRRLVCQVVQSDTYDIGEEIILSHADLTQGFESTVPGCTRYDLTMRAWIGRRCAELTAEESKRYTAVLRALRDDIKRAIR